MKRIIIDYKRCEGCLNCSLVCMQAHSRNDRTALNLSDRRNESRNYIVMDAEGHYRPLFCRHCDNPECVSACINSAMIKDKETGLVMYKDGKCVSCFMCIMNCPYGILKADQETQSRVIKCDFCGNTPEGPSCVQACPTGAIYVKEVIS